MSLDCLCFSSLRVLDVKSRASSHGNYNDCHPCLPLASPADDTHYWRLRSHHDQCNPKVLESSEQTGQDAAQTIPAPFQTLINPSATAPETDRRQPSFTSTLDLPAPAPAPSPAPRTGSAASPRSSLRNGRQPWHNGASGAERKSQKRPRTGHDAASLPRMALSVPDGNRIIILAQTYVRSESEPQVRCCCDRSSSVGVKQAEHDPAHRA